MLNKKIINFNIQDILKYDEKNIFIDYIQLITDCTKVKVILNFSGSKDKKFIDFYEPFLKEYFEITYDNYFNLPIWYNAVSHENVGKFNSSKFESRLYNQDTFFNALHEVVSTVKAYDNSKHLNKDRR